MCARTDDKIDEVSHAKAAKSYGESNAEDGGGERHMAVPASCVGMDRRSGLPGIPFPPVILLPRGRGTGDVGGLQSPWAIASPKRARERLLKVCQGPGMMFIALRSR